MKLISIILLVVLIIGCAPQEETIQPQSTPSKEIPVVGESCTSEPSSLMGNCHMEGDVRVCETTKAL